MTQPLYLQANLNALTGSIPSQLFLLTNLFTVTLSDNNITGRIPTEFWNLIRVWESDTAPTVGYFEKCNDLITSF